MSKLSLDSDNFIIALIAHWFGAVTITFFAFGCVLKSPKLLIACAITLCASVFLFSYINQIKIFDRKNKNK